MSGGALTTWHLPHSHCTRWRKRSIHSKFPRIFCKKTLLLMQERGGWNFFGGAPLFFCVCSQFITVISSLQPTGQNALDQNNLQCGRSSFERKTSWLSKICKLRPLLSRSFEHESHIVAVSNFIILGFVLWPSHHQGNSGLCSIRPSGSLFRLLSYPPLWSLGLFWRRLKCRIYADGP